MGSLYRRSAIYCRTCKSRLSTSATQAACRSARHDVEVRESTIWTIQYQDASARTHIESSKTSDKKKAQHLLRLREWAVARRERVIVENLTFHDAATMVVTDFEVNGEEVVNRRARPAQTLDRVLRRHEAFTDYNGDRQSVHQAPP